MERLGRARPAAAGADHQAFGDDIERGIALVQRFRDAERGQMPEGRPIVQRPIVHGSIVHGLCASHAPALKRFAVAAP